ncbi:hypothetical protein F3Y22_tig00112370pilonHSYRG00041 [Hibiscus syriacus]|uniref:Uncharacterized protein n=1 Tax=Hibiscus syriacus TaxID=106335 RepID=A0A6A2Y8R7_HIBSY|nr:hypothetical protein F3Y22_tig00112370pilonHSYRG00041 [Hibiscus syriacus]
MEALWSLEEKWKLTTQEDVIVVVCAASAIVGLCAAAVLKKKARKKPVEDGDAVSERSTNAKWCEPSCCWVSKRVMWSGAKQWEERKSPLLGLEEYGGGVGWMSQNSESPVWQRSILMGENASCRGLANCFCTMKEGSCLMIPLREVPTREIITR